MGEPTDETFCLLCPVGVDQSITSDKETVAWLKATIQYSALQAELGLLAMTLVTTFGTDDTDDADVEDVLVSG